MRVVLDTDAFVPGRPWILHATVFLGRRPGTRQRMVDRRYLVIEEIRVGLVLENPLLDDALVVAVERKAGIVVGARTFEPARLDLEHIVAAGAALIDPFADRIAREARINLLRPVASV